jgi:hypothetical protein
MEATRFKATASRYDACIISVNPGVLTMHGSGGHHCSRWTIDDPFNKIYLIGCQQLHKRPSITEES